MLRLVFIGHFLAILTLAVKAGEFLQPWTAGPSNSNKDYSNNVYYPLGGFIQTAWDADYTNVTIAFLQDNNPGDARGGPSVTLEKSYNKTTWGWTVSYEGLDPAYSNVFYFSISQADGADSFPSRIFNISGTSATTESSATAALSAGSNKSSSTASSTTQASSGITKPQSSSSTVTGAPVIVATSSATVTIVPSSGRGTPADAIAGIVVGIVVGSLLLVGGAWWAWKIWKRRSTFAPSQPYFSKKQRRYEADGNQIYEMYESRPEADGN